jgi:hypothetical protein
MVKRSKKVMKTVSRVQKIADGLDAVAGMLKNQIEEDSREKRTSKSKKKDQKTKNEKRKQEREKLIALRDCKKIKNYGKRLKSMNENLKNLGKI